MNKICQKCGSVFTKKDGQRNGRQSYRCKDCGHVFQNKTRKRIVESKKLFRSYSVRKQTLKELSEDTGYSVSTIHRRLDEVFSSKKGALLV